MKVDDCLVRGRILLLNEPALQVKTVLCPNRHFLIWHVSFLRVPVCLWVVLWELECLTWGIWNVQHTILHEVDHEEAEYDEECYVHAYLQEKLKY